MDLESCLLGSPTLFHIAQFRAMMRWGWWRGKSLLMLDYPNFTWSFGNKAWNKTQLMKWRRIHMWITRRIFYYICQNLCLLKGPLFWKVFHLPTIGNWIMWEVNCHPQGQLLIWKTQSCVLTMGPRTWS